MKRILLLLSFCFLLLPMLHAQKVGLVLSGGGAKGMTHIGIIRALEENNIPIDYITGTSMGAIIGSLYAMGYSPDDMEALLRSEDFKRWYSGKVEPKYAYYFKKSIPTPEFFNIRFDFKDSLNVKPQLPTSMVNPIQRIWCLWSCLPVLQLLVTVILIGCLFLSAVSLLMYTINGK